MLKHEKLYSESGKIEVAFKVMKRLECTETPKSQFSYLFEVMMYQHGTSTYK
jgi:hypothetical protein